MKDKLDLLIAIPVKNEAKNLPNCLKCIGSNFAAKVVVIDSGSTDNTKEIAANFGVEVVDFKWNGEFPKKRNWFLRNYNFDYSWVLFLDADEFLTQEFKDEVSSKIVEPQIDGYWLNYTNFFMGKRLKGGYPLKKLALFKVGFAEYECLAEDNWSNLDMEVHEHPILQGKSGSIRSRIVHQDFKNLDHYLAKHMEYSSWEAKRYYSFLDLNKGDFTLMQKIKYGLLKTPFVGPLYFLGSYIMYGGFLDGIIGFHFSILKMSYFTQISLKIIELKGVDE
ncbi:glycosyltransferase family 2 protein [Algoriphagus chordae]|uniref:Glycosyltransferase involved in cell wall biosynthesis n=1 Tax=Algoriphagus chordae TaxID=237019 RepID=A0A2W7QY87_9BACT|nr:glycosyltransferase family 2 protein [Algoriphagus chordae]PZX52076.1 glycosyltransferase involved in cell wall biosynthesis [Algoriphagus chordae]